MRGTSSAGRAGWRCVRRVDYACTMDPTRPFPRTKSRTLQIAYTSAPLQDPRSATPYRYGTPPSCPQQYQPIRRGRAPRLTHCCLRATGTGPCAADRDAAAGALAVDMGLKQALNPRPGLARLDERVHCTRAHCVRHPKCDNDQRSAFLVQHAIEQQLEPCATAPPPSLPCPWRTWLHAVSSAAGG